MRVPSNITLAGTAMVALLAMVSPAVAQISGTSSSPATIIVPARALAPATVQSQSTTIEQTVTTPGTGPAKTTTSVTTTTTETVPALKPPAVVQFDEPIKTTIVQSHPKRHRHDARSALKMAKYHWLDKAVEADPSLVESICRHYEAALILAKHPRLGAIAQHDHYTCRRLCKWKTVARALARNGECEKVIALDPEGIYRAVKLDRRLARILAKNPMFDQMIADNPDLGRLLSLYI